MKAVIMFVSTIWLIVVLMIAYMYFSNKHDVSDNTPEKLYMVNIGTEDDPIYRRCDHVIRNVNWVDHDNDDPDGDGFTDDVFIEGKDDPNDHREFMGDKIIVWVNVGSYENVKLRKRATQRMPDVDGDGVSDESDRVKYEKAFRMKSILVDNQ